MSEFPAIEVHQLSKSFQTGIKKNRFLAVDRVDLTVGAGEVYGLIGPNGSGKSTTMKAVLGLMRPDHGYCRVFGQDSLRVDSRAHIGFLPENPYFYKHMTGEETLQFFGRLCGLKGKKLKQRVEYLLEMTSLEEASKRRLGGYSKGMLQRVGLAQAMIQEPRLLVLDEPTAGVDPLGSRQIRDLILRLKSEGISIFLCSHLLEQVQEVCDHIGIIYRGKMLKQGPVESLLSVQNQVEIVVQNASPDLLAQLHAVIERDPSANMISQQQAKYRLEKLFLDEIQAESQV